MSAAAPAGAQGLTLQGLRRRYPGAPAVLEGLDLEVPSGGCVALLGPSGVGKSTVLRLAAGLDTPDGGRVLVGGRDVTGVATERRGTAMVFQRPRLFPHLRVLDNVAFPLVVTGTAKPAARAAAVRFLELVGAAALAGRRPGSLSGGQEQRVALARALAARPAVLLLDEPFSALDPAVRAQMQQLLGELRATVEPTVLIVTHDRHEASVVADTVAVLLDGRVAQHDRPETLHARPASLAVSRFLGGLNEIPGALEGDVHVSRAGRIPVPALLRGAGRGAVLVVRQEAVRLVSPDDPDADVTGVVRRVSVLGPRVLVEVATAAGPLFAEIPAGSACDVGDALGVHLPPGQRWCVPDAAPACGCEDAAGAAPAPTDPQTVSTRENLR